jgi:hypothetical protein
MCSPLIVFVADPYRTEASCAVLGHLQQTERRRSGRRVQFVFNPTGTPEPNLLGGADGAVLVLLEGQKAAAETLLSFWEKLTKSQDRSLPVLPVVVQAGTTQTDPHLFSVPVPDASSTVVVSQSDIVIEHGGYVSLSSAAEEDLDQALQTVLQRSGAQTLHNSGGTCAAFAQ